MTALKNALAGALNSCVRVAGRHRMARLTRFLNDQVRLDLRNDPTSNGEYALVAALARQLTAGDHVIDAGANIGDWTNELVSRTSGTHIVCHLFEPATETAAVLDRRLAKLKGADFVLNQVALSDRDGEAELGIVHPLAGVNSLAGADPSDAQVTERVRTIRLDSYCDERGVESVAFTKLDLEGWDCKALEGAPALLNAGRLKIIQFEYNWRWINARSYLKDAFALLQKNGYALGKLTPQGIEQYDGWNADLESFKEANFIAVHSSAQLDFPRLQDWRTRTGEVERR